MYYQIIQQAKPCRDYPKHNKEEKSQTHTQHKSLSNMLIWWSFSFTKKSTHPLYLFLHAVWFISSPSQNPGKLKQNV